LFEFAIAIASILTSVAVPGRLFGSNDADSFSNPLILRRPAPVLGFPSRYAPATDPRARD